MLLLLRQKQYCDTAQLLTKRKVNSIVSNGTIFHTTYSMEKKAMDNTNNTHHIVLTIAELTLLLVTSFLTGSATVETFVGGR